MMHWEITLTMEHIRQGVRKDPCRCPLALACNDAGWVGARVYDNRIDWGVGSADYTAFFTAELADLVAKYDAGLADFIPGTYQGRYVGLIHREKDLGRRASA
jgi:hypothetical protein